MTQKNRRGEHLRCCTQQLFDNHDVSLERLQFPAEQVTEALFKSSPCIKVPDRKKKTSTAPSPCLLTRIQLARWNWSGYN